HRASGNVYTAKGFQARPEPLDGVVNGADLDGLGPGPIASPDAERRRHKNPNLLSATDADDPAGCAAQRARARQTLCAGLCRGVRYPDHDAAGRGSGLEKLLCRTAGGGPGRLRPVHRCSICKPDKGLFRRKLRRRSADDTRIAWRRRDRQNEAAAAGRSDRQYKLPGPPRAGGRHLSQRNHQRSRHAARRIRLRRCGRRCRRLDQEIAGSNRRFTWEVMFLAAAGNAGKPAVWRPNSGGKNCPMSNAMYLTLIVMLAAFLGVAGVVVWAYWPWR